jgi:hypothetical protein
MDNIPADNIPAKTHSTHAYRQAHTETLGGPSIAAFTADNDDALDLDINFDIAPRERRRQTGRGKQTRTASV